MEWLKPLLIIITIQCLTQVRPMNHIHNTTENIPAKMQNSSVSDNKSAKYENNSNSESNKLKCESLNVTEYPSLHTNIVTSLRLNDIYSSVTTNLIESKVSVSQMENNGHNLYELVTSRCGGSVVCDKVNVSLSTSKVITIGFLGHYARSQTILGALPLAVAAVNKEPALLPGFQLKFIAADIGKPRPALPFNRESLSLRVMTQMRDLGVVSFFGLDNSCHTEAKLAAAWNLPLLSHKCSGAHGTPFSSNPGLGSTFARTLPPAYKVSKSIIALLTAFKWNKFAIIAEIDLTAAAQLMEAIKELALLNNMTITAEEKFKEYIPKHRFLMENIVEETYEKTRIYIFLGEHMALVDFVKELWRRRLLQDGQYAVVAVDDEIYDPNSSAVTYADILEQNNSDDTLAFRAVLKLTPSFPSNPRYGELCHLIRNLAATPPFCVPNYHELFNSVSMLTLSRESERARIGFQHLIHTQQVPIEAAHLYDAVTLWARAATAAMNADLPLTDGATLMKLLKPTTYRSIQGFDVYMDNAGDAEGNFTVVGVIPDEKAPGGWSVQPVATFRYTNSSNPLPELVGESKISWISGKPPIVEPECGFDGTKCASTAQDPVVFAAVAAVVAAAILAAALLVRHYRYEQKLASVLWRIEAKDLNYINAFEGRAGKNSVPQEVDPRRAHTTIAVYRGNIVAVKRLQKKSIDITRAIKKELKQIRELRHENLNAFVGVCVENGACIVSAYCSRGSLSRVLADRDLHLDDMFVASLVADLLRGLTYLHDSSLVSHGNLTSSNCLVDSRWVLQIADYGLHNLKCGAEAEDALRFEKRMLWRAPELLRDPNPPSRGSQKGDVYSFGIILYEILGRNGPWGDTNLTNAEIIGRVRQPIGGVIFRPSLSGLAARPSVLAALNACWSERPDRRPDLRLVRLRLKDMHAGMKTNIFDNMLAMMEKYASNLEALVAARTEQLLQEKRRTDDLLHRMLPRTVAEALKRGERVQAESYDCVTIYFSDIVGFTKMAAINTPMQIVEILNDLYTSCDAIISYYNVYKVETIGDAYMVVGGLPERCSRHASEVASLALHVLDAVPKIRSRHNMTPKLQIRIGIHSGQCAAGVVGVMMPRYCLFGDTVNTAARMESSGEPQKIHVSNDTYMLLKKQGGYHFQKRGIVNIRGKGDMRTWWLVGEDHMRRKNSIFNYQLERSDGNENWLPNRSILDIRDRARLSCGSLRPGSALSSPGPPACACFVPQRDHHSAPVVSFCDD